MPLTSMTGFARTDGVSGGWRWHLEAKSVNGKSLDVRLRLPGGLEALEMEIRERAARRFKRGNIQVSMDLSRDSPVWTVTVNEPVLVELSTAATRVANALGAPAPSIDALLALKGVVEVSEHEDTPEEVESRNAAILRSVDELFDALLKNRAAEGARIEAVLKSAVDRIEALTASARDNPSRTTDAIKARLAEQVAKLLEASSTFDADRLHQRRCCLPYAPTSRRRSTG